MRASGSLAAALVASLVIADVAVAQPPPPSYGGRGRPTGQFGPQPPGAPGGFQHYYNGRWIGPDEWRRRAAPERDRWSRNYRRRHDEGAASALLGGIIGFALGAAIVGSAQQAEHARTADASWDDYCARKYRSYDRASRTYLGVDGVRHYCQ
jgi:hypothetical protein